MNRVRPKLVAIVGGSGSGKSWLAGKLQQAFGENVSRISLDAFYRDRSHLSPARRSCINYDHPRSIDWASLEETLLSLGRGQPVMLPHYDFATHTRSRMSQRVMPAPIVLVEGLWLLRRPAVRKLFALTIFLDCTGRLRLQRRLTRDAVERGRSENSVRRQFRETVAPMHEKFVDPQKAHADVVLKSPLGEKDGVVLFEQLWPLLSADAIYLPSARERMRRQMAQLFKEEK